MMQLKIADSSRYRVYAEISKESDRLPNKKYSPKGFYYQGKNDKYIILVGDRGTGSTVRIKLLREHVKLRVVEDERTI